jgi:hypothetical protein
MLDIFKKELTEEEAGQIRERLKAWKDEVYVKLHEQVEQQKTEAIAKLNEQSISYKKALKRKMKSKLNEAISEMRVALKSEVVQEMYEENPEMKVLEAVKTVIAPLMGKNVNEATTIVSLQNKIKELESKEMIREGKEKLGELISPYDEKTQKILTKLIGEGTVEEVTEKFYDIAESLEIEDDKIVESVEEDDEELVSEDVEVEDDEIEEEIISEDEDLDIDSDEELYEEDESDEYEPVVSEDINEDTMSDEEILDNELGLSSEQKAIQKLAKF